MGDIGYSYIEKEKDSTHPSCNTHHGNVIPIFSFVILSHIFHEYYEEHGSNFKLLTCALNLNLIKHLCDVLNKQVQQGPTWQNRLRFSAKDERQAWILEALDMLNYL